MTRSREVTCGKPMRPYELPGIPVFEDPACGRAEGHRPPCRSAEAMARHAAAQRPGRSARQAPSGSAAVAAAIADARRYSRLSRAALALALGVTERAVEHWEEGRRTPGPQSWEQLELTLGPLGIVRDPRPEAVEDRQRGSEAA
jgi:DNA-binding transcriptional regulator YiaG